MVMAAVGGGIAFAGAASTAIGAGITASAQDRIARQIADANTSFFNAQFDTASTAADELFGLGTTDQLNFLNFLQQQAGQERVTAGETGTRIAEQKGQDVIGQVVGGIPGFSNQQTSLGTGLGRIDQQQGRELAFSQGLGLDVLGAQGLQQGLEGFDTANLNEFLLSRSGLSRTAEQTSQRNQAVGASEQFAQSQLLNSLQQKLQDAGAAGDVFKTIGSLGQLAGTGIMSAGAFSPLPPGIGTGA